MKITKLDYTFSFSAFQNQYTKVDVFNHRDGVQNSFNIMVDDNALSINGFPGVPSLSADLIDLAIAIHAVDRLIKRQGSKPLTFSVKVPIRNFDRFVENNVAQNLAETLEWYTNDYWQFSFSKRNTFGRDVELQDQFPWKNLPSKKLEVALWSGGLDSLSGLHTQLLKNPEAYYVLIGTGSNSQVHKKQDCVAGAINQLFPERTRLVKVPYFWSNTPPSEKSFGQRSRGLVFMLIGAACAYRIGSNSLFLFENGIGAINLPYSRAELGLDHAKSVHPLSLLRVGNLISAIVNNHFEIANPFWLSTKAQMVESLLTSSNTHLIPLSSSCDRARRLKNGVTQCGMCTSCLLRRQSLAALKIEDLSTYYNNGYFTKDTRHLHAMQFQVDRLRVLLNQENPWRGLTSEYYDLDDIVDQISKYYSQDRNDLKQQIIRLYSNYVDEWRLFEEYIAKNSAFTHYPNVIAYF